MSQHDDHTMRKVVENAIDGDEDVRPSARRLAHAVAFHFDHTMHIIREWIQRTETGHQENIDELWEEMKTQKKLILSMAMIAVTAIVGAAIRIMFFGQ